MTPKLLYIGMQYDYGDRFRGLSYEHRNFYDSLQRFCRERGWEMIHYDFMQRGSVLGREAMSEELLDLATGTDFAFLFAVLFDPSRDPSPEVFSRIGERGRTRTVHWFCDDHWKFDTYSRLLAPHFHFSCTTAQSAVEKYAAAGLADRMIKTQWACNHHLYVPCNAAREIDLSFVGMPHGNRRQVLSKLAAAGIAAEIFGFGWENRSRLPFHRMVRLFSRSRINLNLSNASADSGQQIKGRNFEIPGTGSFQLSADAENLTDYYTEDREIAIFRSDEELVDKVRYFLAHESEREAIARSAFQRTLAEHTWQHRFEAIFERVGRERTAPAARVAADTEPSGAGASAKPGDDSMDAPMVSVIIPCFNQARYLAEAVASVAEQTYPALEVIIVNDGSPDDTSATARKLMARHPHLSIRLIEQENAGLPAARNAGVATSRGTYWLPLDADDRIAPTFVETCVKALTHAPEAGFAYADIQHFGELDTVFRLPAFDAEVMVHKNNIGCVCSLVRRQAWEDVGGYDACMRAGYEDWDFWVGCIEKGWTGVRVARPLFYYRKRGDSMLTDARKKHDALFARIVLNHPSLYTVEEISAAAQTIQDRTRAEIDTTGEVQVKQHRERLTITYLIHSVLGVTGGNQTLIRQTNALADRGHRVHIVTYSERPSWYAFKADLIRVPSGAPMADHVPPSDVVIATYFLNAPELARIEAPVKIYFAQGDQYVFGDDTPVNDPAARAERERMRRLCAESYALPGIRFMTNSFNLAATVRYRYGRRADAVLPSCRDQSIFRPLDRQPAPPWRILVVGPDARGSDVEPLSFKGIGDIRKALDLLAQDAPAFRVVRMSNTVADIFKGYPCEFHFKPADRKKTEIFGAAHILIYASHYDSCPLPPMEAMAAGAAVVCTATPGALEYCRHQENALLVPTGAPAAIAGAVRRVMGDAALYQRLVAGGSATAACYPREREWDALEGLLYRFIAQTVPAEDHRSATAPSIDDASQHAPTAVVAENHHCQEKNPMNAQHAIAHADHDTDAAFRRISTPIDSPCVDDAVSGLNRIPEDHQEHADAHNQLGVLYTQQGDNELALAHFRRAVALAPGNVTFRKNLADFLYVKQGDVRGALEIYVAVLRETPDDVETLMTTGHICVSVERFDDAAHFYQRVLAAEPWHADAGRYLDALARHRGEPEADIITDPETIYREALEKAETGDTAGAAQALASLVAAHPGHALAHNDLGVIYGRQQCWDEALAHYRKAVALEPSSTVFQKNLADCCAVTQDNFQEALEIYVNLLAADPYDVEALMATGQICMAVDRPEDAEHFYQRALEAEPWNVEVRNLLDALKRQDVQPAVDADGLMAAARELAEKGDAAGAVEILERLVAAHPDHGAAHNDLGVLHHRQNDVARAEVHYTRAAALDSTNTIFQKNLADFYAVAMNRYEAALQIYVNLLAIDPYDVEALMGTGHICRLLERYDDAAHFFDRVLEAEPWHADARQCLDAIGQQRVAVAR
ncbi:MAG: tetratricopeptide repeat protein [Pseudomonadota bacterium]